MLRSGVLVRSVGRESQSLSRRSDSFRDPLQAYHNIVNTTIVVVPAQYQLALLLPALV